MAELIVAAAVAATGATLSATATTVAVAVVNVGIAVTASAIAAALARGDSGARTASLPPEEAAASNFRQSSPPQRVIYGRQRVGGPLFFLDDSNPPFLYWGVLLSARPISRVRHVRLGDRGVVLDPSGAAVTPQFQGKLWGSFRLGGADQPIDPILAADFPLLPATFRQRGHATAVFKADFGTDTDEHAQLWGGTTIIPSVLIDVDGAPVYDPWASGQDPSDPGSWTFSRNAVRIIVDYLMADYGGRIPPDRFDWDKVRAAVAYADSLVGQLNGPLEKRWLLDGVISKDQKPIDVMAGMLLCSRSFIGWTQGKVWVQSSEKRLPAKTIHDKMIVGGFEYNASRPRKAVLNKVRTRFSSTDREYQVADGPILHDVALETEDQELLEATIDLPFVTAHRQAQRLAKAMLAESRLGPSLSLPCNLDAIALEAGDVVKVWSRLFSPIPGLNGNYMIEEVGFAEDFSRLALSLTAYDGDIDGDWHPEVDEQEFTVESIEV